MTLIDEYLEYQQNAETKYGKNAIVLYENGHFYEVYGVDNDKETIGNAKRISEILNIVLTRKNKKILENSRSNPLLVGVPTISINKHLKTLINNKFTVVFVEQITPPPEPKRGLTRILSPTTYIGEECKSDSNYLLSIYFESCLEMKSLGKTLMVGMSCIDLTTGDSLYYQLSSVNNDYDVVFEDMYRFIETIDPKEILVHFSRQDIFSVVEISERLEFDKRIVHSMNDVTKEIFKLTYQNEFLSKIYKNTGMMQPIEYINMEFKQETLLSYLILLIFTHEHDERILKNLGVPEEWERTRYLILNHNSLYQLNIVPDNTLDNPFAVRSLFDIINNTSTPMGKRLLRSRLLNPIISEKVLNERYETLDKMINYEDRDKFDDHFKIIIDLERFLRKMCIGYLHPHEFASLDITLSAIKRIIDLYDKLELENTHIKLKDFDRKLFSMFCEEYNNTFDISLMGSYNQNNITQSFFRKGIYKEIDDIENEALEVKKFFKNEALILSNYIETGSDLIKKEQNERDGHFLMTTKKRAEIITKKIGKDTEYTFKTQSANNVRIMSKKISAASEKLLAFESKLGTIMREKFLIKCDEFYNKFGDLFSRLNQFLAELDVVRSHSITCIKNGYFRPILEKKGEGHSYFEAKDMRHPIIEKIQTNIPYVANDIRLERDGILLFGLNGGGKSSLLKSVGLAIIMAQMGMYVPAKDFKYYPFKTLYTRIMGNDNIFKGLSSFAVEMSELRTILKHSNENSLILGDEICRGTEIHSALSIVSSAVNLLCEKKTNFLFATHLHKLHEIDIISDIENLRKFYIPLEIINNKIIYGRKLKEGVGEYLYGLEVAEHIIRNDEFISLANKVRKNLMGIEKELYSSKSSRYNSEVYVDKCVICGSREQLDTHHIKFQCTADENGMIDTMDKDVKNNLVVLCKHHHQEVHKGNIEIEGYVETSVGRQLVYHDSSVERYRQQQEIKEAEEEIKKKKQADEKKRIYGRSKYTQEMIEKIFSYRKMSSNFSMRDIKYKIKLDHGITIGIPTLKKILSGEYSENLFKDTKNLDLVFT